MFKKWGITPKDIIVGIGFTGVGSILALIIGAWLEKISFLHIDWLRLVEIGIVMFILWSWLRLKQKMQADGVRVREDYEKAIIAHKAEYAALLEDVKKGYKKEVAEAKAELTTVMNSQSTNFSNWAINHANAHGQEQKALMSKFDALRKQLNEHVEDVNRNLSTRIQNNWNSTAEWQNAHNIAHGGEQKIYKDQLEALKEKLTDKQLSESGN